MVKADTVNAVPLPVKLTFLPDIGTFKLESINIESAVNVCPHGTDELLKVGAERDMACFVTWIVMLEEDDI